MLRLVPLLFLMAMAPLSACAEEAAPGKVQETFGPNCVVASECGDLLYINCNSETDGPAYYVKKDGLEVVMKCGGLCMSPYKTDDKTQCTACPPAEWTCGR